MESIWVFLLRDGEGMLSCLPSNEMDTPGWLPSSRHEFSGSNESNSTYSPRRMACLVLGWTWEVRDACEGGWVRALGWDTGWESRLATKCGSPSWCCSDGCCDGGGCRGAKGGCCWSGSSAAGGDDEGGRKVCKKESPPRFEPGRDGSGDSRLILWATQLAKTEYIHRHDKAAAYIH